MRALIAAVWLLALLGGPAWADDVTDLMDGGKKLYEAGKYGKAIKELQFAINEIQSKLSKQFAAAMPPAPAGWKAEEVEAAGMGIIGGGQVITRKYRQEGGSGVVTAQLMADNPMIQGIAMMLNNPMLLGTQRGTRRVRIKGEDALLQWKGAERGGELSAILGGGRLMLQVQGRDIAEEKILTDFMRSWDFDAVKKLMDL